MRPPSQPGRRAPLTAAALGLLVCLYFFDPRVLDPRRIDWVSGNDAATNFLGWHFFRHEAWQWPPGLLEGYANGAGASIGLTDSIPLLAFALKPFDAWLPPAVNYLGLWIALCYALQGYFGDRLLERMGLARGRAVLGAVVLCAMPFLAARAALHIPLASHFLLLAALYVYLDAAEDATRFARWVPLMAVAAAINPYLFVIVGPVFAASALAQLAWGPTGTRSRTIALAVATVAASTAVLYLEGFFSVSVANTWGGYGQQQVNLLAWLNPQGTGTLLPTLGVSGAGQTDAYMYLGAGGLLVMAAGAFNALRGRPRWRAIHAPLALAALAILAFAISHRVALGSRFLVELPLPHALQEALDPFRSSGRMAWLPTYLAIAAALALCGRMGRLGFIALAVAAVGLNLYDVRPLRATGTSLVARAAHPGHPDCAPLPAKAERVVVLPRMALEDYSIADAFPLAVCAAEQGQPLNVGYLARLDLARVDAAQRRDAEHLDRPRPGVAYAFRNPAVAAKLGVSPGAPTIGPFHVTTVPAAPPEARVDPAWAWPLAIDMGATGRGRDVQLAGWAPPHVGIVHNYAREASLLLPVPRDLDAEARLSIAARVLPGDAGPLRVAVKANGVEVGALALGGEPGVAKHAIAIPREVVRAARGALRVELALPDVVPFIPRRAYPEDRPRLWVTRVELAAVDPAVVPLAFAAGALEAGVLREGWSAAEAWGTWSNAPVARLALPLPAKREGTLVLRVFGHAFAAGGAQVVRVVVEGRPLAEWEYASLANDAWREVEIPAEALPPEGRALQVAFEVVRPAAPGPTDPRLLGIALVRVEMLRR